MGFSCSSADEESAYNGGYLGSVPGLEGPLEKEKAPTSVFVLGESHGLPGSSVHGVARVGHDLATKPPPPAGL